MATRPSTDSGETEPLELHPGESSQHGTLGGSTALQGALSVRRPQGWAAPGAHDLALGGRGRRQEKPQHSVRYPAVADTPGDPAREGSNDKAGVTRCADAHRRPPGLVNRRRRKVPGLLLGTQNEKSGAGGVTPARPSRLLTPAAARLPRRGQNPAARSQLAPCTRSSGGGLETQDDETGVSGDTRMPKRKPPS
ncbi:hypothetical protein TREES_T100010897 [Tupaia chinensis]|uniref:Uncharacterized protein n=1 Tax=Tupaia chinensis TaxID=246437 RepID=L9JS69_TUPCH|nr:hypothetical protein TREES_T100010897 [Tupaia chinensis]